MFVPRSVIVFVLLFYCYNTENISFKNVTMHGYSVFTHKFKKVIESSNSLKEEIPKDAVFDAIEMTEQNIPILYENCIADMRPLDELILKHNGIQEIQPGAFKNLKGLRLIKLQQNELKTIKAGVFNHLPVSTIDLSENSISVIEDEAFDNMSELLTIRLTDNKISKWNGNWFKNTPLLSMVSFQHNLIEELPKEAFKNMMGVKKFQRLSFTINLIFSYNRIKTVHPETFKGLQEINNLWLDNNLLEDLPENMLNGISVRNLRLSSNKLTCIKDKDSLLKGEMNDIDANPLDCECLAGIKTWAEANNKTLTFFYSDMDCFAKKLDIKMKGLQELLKETREKSVKV